MNIEIITRAIMMGKKDEQGKKQLKVIYVLYVETPNRRREEHSQA